MRKILLGCIVSFVLLFPTAAHAEDIQSFTGTYVIGADGRVNVQEQIMYDFGDASRHGIYRTIPLIKTNTDGKKFQLSLTDINVTNGKDEWYPYTSSLSNGTETLKIGSAAITISGVHAYWLNYTVSGALTYFSDHDELYWNVTGDQWPAAIDKASATVKFPQTLAASDVRLACYTGVAGSTDQNCKATYDKGVATITTTVPLNPSEGLTIVVGFPKNIAAVLEPVPYVSFWDTLGGKIVLLLIVVGSIIWYLILPVWIIIHWFKVGRDPKPPAGEAHVWFDAPKTASGRSLTPGETGTLIDEEADLRDITATIIDLARRGYMKIVEKKKNDFYLVKKKDFSKGTDLQAHEIRLLDGIFSDDTDVRIKDADLVSTVSDVKSKLYAAVVSEKFFDKSPDKTRTKYYVLAFFGFCTGNVFLMITAFFFGRAMPKKTLLGAQAAAVARGLRTFLTSQENYLAGQAKTQVFFEKLLPFAIAFGVEKLWAERFKDIEMKQPGWYQGYGNNAFTSLYLINALSTTTNNFVSAATPTRSSSGFSSGFGGGGFSGGGGGGGGGGSW